MRSERDVTREMRFRRGPAWRWREAQSIVSSDCIDAPIGCPILSRIVAYVAHLHRHGGQPPLQLRRFAALRAAHALEEDAQLVESAKMLVLARISLPRIARRLGLELQAVRWWAWTFFDVAENLEACDWINIRVIMPLDAEQPKVAAQLRFAYNGGPVIAESLLDGQTTPTRGKQEEVLWAALALRVDQALSMALTDPDAAAKALCAMLRLQQEQEKAERASQRQQRAEAARVREHECQLAQLRYKQAQAELATARLKHDVSAATEGPLHTYPRPAEPAGGTEPAKRTA